MQQWSCPKNILKNEEWLKDLQENGYPVHIFFLVLANVFHSVNHKILWPKLYNFGIGIARGWVNRFLSNRSYCAKLGDIIYFHNQGFSGVLQGSAIGPLFMYIFGPADLLADVAQTKSS